MWSNMYPGRPPAQVQTPPPPSPTQAGGGPSRISTVHMASSEIGLNDQRTRSHSEGRRIRPRRATPATQRCSGRHAGRVACDACARYFLTGAPKSARVRRQRAPATRPTPRRRPDGCGGPMKEGKAQREVESEVGVGGPRTARPQTVCRPPRAAPSDAHAGPPAGTRPYPWPLPSKGGPTRWKRAGTQGSRGSNSHHTQLTRGRCLARRGSKPPSLLTERTR